MRPFFYIILTFTLTLGSCATLFNSKRTSLTVMTTEPSKLIVVNDTLNYLSTQKNITVDRGKKLLPITVSNDSNFKSVLVKRTISPTCLLNLTFSWLSWIGFIVDIKTQKGFTYPKTIYIDIKDTTESYLTYIPLDTPYNKYSNIFKVTPLKLIDIINPSIECIFERKTSGYFGTQVMASYLLNKTYMDIGSFNPNIIGFRFAVEEKLYFKKSAAIGPYASFEINYLKNKYHSIWNFGVKDIYSDSTYNLTNYPDTFGVKKQTLSFNLKLGYQYIYKRVSFDLFGGFGLRYRNVKHFDRINPDDEMEGTRHPNIYAAMNKEGKYWTVSIPINLRIGWTF